jgi:uncharacterized membrane protein
VAVADPSPVTIDDTAPPLMAGNNGEFTSALGFSNLTTAPLAVAVTPDGSIGANCKLTAAPTALPKAQHTDVTITVSAGCAVDDRQGITFMVAVGKQSAPFTITSAPAPSPTPNWAALDAFWIALLALLVSGVVGWIKLRSDHRTKSLDQLDSTWSFSDSWASNATVIAGVLTGIFGTSDIVKNFLGPDADSAVAVAVVGGAVGAALVAIAPIVLVVSKNRAGDVTVAGLLAACAITLTGAYGELWTVYDSAHRMSLGGLENNLLIPTLAAMVLLAIYAVRSIDTVIRQGQTKPAKVTSDTILAALMVVKALRAKNDVDETLVDQGLDELATQQPQLNEGTTIVDPIRRRRAALL